MINELSPKIPPDVYNIGQTFIQYGACKQLCNGWLLVIVVVCRVKMFYNYI